MNEASLAELKRTLESESIDGVRLLENPCDNPICALSHEEGIGCVVVIWRKYVTSAQLRFIHEIILDMLAGHGADKILADDSDLPIIHAEDQKWIVDSWLPRARAAGLKSVATKVSLTFFGKLSIASVHSRIAREITLRNFQTIDSARAWLAGMGR